MNKDERDQLHEILLLMIDTFHMCQPASWAKSDAIHKLRKRTATLFPEDQQEQQTDGVSLEQQIKDLEEVLADKRRLTRELDVALSGPENAAKQASLCDLIPIAKKLREDVEQAEMLLARALDYVPSTSLVENDIIDFLDRRGDR